MAIDPGVFRAYDIRGKVGAGISEELAEVLGKAFGTYITRDEPDGHEAQVVAGQDNRDSGQGLKAALMRGIASTGAVVRDIGMTTSPALYYTVGNLGITGGVNVTGSHNPPDENGFKLVGAGNWPIAGDEIQAVRSIIESGDFRTGVGRIEPFDHKPAYFAQIERSAKLARAFRVAVDTGNGVAGLYAPPMLKRLGCELVELYTDLDSSYPNHLPDPQMPENMVDLQELVRESGVDIGLAFDGDGDRLGVVDERGVRHEADYILMLLARDMLTAEPGARVIVDIKTSQPVLDDITERGGEPIVWKTGHSNIKIKMREGKTPLAGEASGHIFYRDNYYADDALYAACQLLTFLSKSDKPLSAHLAGIPRWYTSPELRVPCADDKKWGVVEAVAATLRKSHPAVEIDGIRATFPDGWALVRASNTGPNLTVRFESKTEEGLAAIDAEVKAALAGHVETW